MVLLKLISLHLLRELAWLEAEAAHPALEVGGRLALALEHLAKVSVRAAAPARRRAQPAYLRSAVDRTGKSRARPPRVSSLLFLLLHRALLIFDDNVAKSGMKDKETDDVLAE